MLFLCSLAAFAHYVALQRGAVLGVCVVVDLGLTVFFVCVVVGEVVWGFMGV